MWNQKLINILGRYVLILCFVIKYIRTYHDINPNWKKILTNLHNKVDEIYGGNKRHEDAYSGRFYKYILPKGEDKDEYEAYEEGTTKLPRWLSFETSKRKLHGVPTDEDIRSGIKIVFRRKHENTVNGLIGESKFIVINVYNNREPFTCEIYTGNNTKRGTQGPYATSPGIITTGSIIFSANISKDVGRKRVRLLRKIAQQLDQPITSLFLEIGNRLRNDVALENGIRMAGPGDRVTISEPGFTVTWKIKCARDIAGDKNIGFLGELSAREDFSSTFKDPVLGWFVHTSEDGPFRYRRDIGAAGQTPVATPALGTPTISPSPSVVVSPTMIKPSKSASPIVKTSAVITPPPVASPTAPRTQSTTQKLSTTIEITTTPPATTTKEPTTKVPTTKEPTTIQPTTKQPTTKQPTTKQPTTKQPTTKESTTKESTTKEPTTTKRTTTVQIITKEPITFAPKSAIQPSINEDETIGRIEVFEHSAHEEQLNNLFIYDKPLSIELEYYPDQNSKPQPFLEKNWIEYKNHKLYLLPKEENIGLHMFALKGTDVETGKYTMDTFHVNVKDDTRMYNNLFNVTVTLDYLKVSRSAKQQVELIQGIATATNQDNYGMLRAVSVVEGGGIVWSLADPQYTGCRNTHVDNYLKLIQSEEFRKGFDFAGVLGVGMVEKSPCTPNVLPSKVVGSDDNLWQRILIPVIVIVVLLLIIALILCCVYRRKRKANVQIEEDKAYLNHKKPVIFLEEFDEKPHFVSLQPLILPNEKPPTPGHPYEPRADTPEGPGSSTTVSTESEEKPLTPQSPKESSRKGYNAPPPYNSL